MKNFRTCHLAVEFYRLACTLELQSHLKEQLQRAASSTALDLAEGRGRLSKKDQARFFQISFGSLRECQAILDLAAPKNSRLIQDADVLAAHIYRLIRGTAG